MPRVHVIPLLVLLTALALSGCAHTPAGDAAPPATTTVVDAAEPLEDAVPAADGDAAIDVAEAAPAVDAELDTDTDTDTSTAAPAVATAPADDTGADDPRTDAEREYDALYGSQDGDTDSLPTPAELEQSYDPWEGFNRRMHSFNNVVDRVIAKPLAKFYMAVLPRPVRLGVGNFFSNMQQPLTALNSVLQGKPKQAAQALGRFAVNATLGIGGVFDPATNAGIPNKNEDFGQTLGVWGWKQSRYVELPLFGPRTVRDLFGMVGDTPFALLRPIEEDKIRVFLQGLQLVDVRTQLMAVDSMREGATDDYALLRDAWTQRRNYQIFGDRQLEGDDNLPDYLREEDNPLVPVDAIPVTPMDGG